MVDRALLAAKIATIRDATARVRAMLPASAEIFIADRTAREVVTLNLFVAIQTCLDLATHWLADAGWNMPGTYADVLPPWPSMPSSRVSTVTQFSPGVVIEKGMTRRRVALVGACPSGKAAIPFD